MYAVKLKIFKKWSLFIESDETLHMWCILFYQTALSVKKLLVSITKYEIK